MISECCVFSHPWRANINKCLQVGVEYKGVLIIFIATELCCFLYILCIYTVKLSLHFNMFTFNMFMIVIINWKGRLV